MLYIPVSLSLSLFLTSLCILSTLTQLTFVFIIFTLLSCQFATDPVSSYIKLLCSQYNLIVDQYVLIIDECIRDRSSRRSRHCSSIRNFTRKQSSPDMATSWPIT